MAFKTYESKVNTPRGTVYKAPVVSSGIGQQLIQGAADILEQAGSNVQKQMQQQREINGKMAELRAEDAIFTAQKTIEDRIASGQFEGNIEKYTEMVEGSIKSLRESGAPADQMQMMQARIQSQAQRGLVNIKVKENARRRETIYDNVKAREEMRGNQFVNASPVQQEAYINETVQDYRSLANSGVITQDEAQLAVSRFVDKSIINQTDALFLSGKPNEAVDYLMSNKDSISPLAFEEKLNYMYDELNIVRNEASALNQVYNKYTDDALAPNMSQKDVDVLFQDVVGDSEDPQAIFDATMNVSKRTGKVPTQFQNQLTNALMIPPEQVSRESAEMAFEAAQNYNALTPVAQDKIPENIRARAEAMNAMTRFYGNTMTAAQRISSIDTKISRTVSPEIKKEVMDRTTGILAGIMGRTGLTQMNRNEIGKMANVMVASGMDEESAVKYATSNFLERNTDEFLGKPTTFSPNRVLPNADRNVVEKSTKKMIGEILDLNYPNLGRKEKEAFMDSAYLVAPSSTILAAKEGDLDNMYWNVYVETENDFGAPHIEMLQGVVTYTPEEFMSDRGISISEMSGVAAELKDTLESYKKMVAIEGMDSEEAKKLESIISKMEKAKEQLGAN